MERAGILHLGFLTRMKQSDRSEEHTSELQSPCNLVCRIIISEKHTSELQSPCNLVCRLLLEKKKNIDPHIPRRHPSHPHHHLFCTPHHLLSIHASAARPTHEV